LERSIMPEAKDFSEKRLPTPEPAVGARDLTSGSVTAALVRFSLPFLLANLVQNLYSLVDLFVVGRFADAAGLSAVSLGGLVMGSFNCAVIGLTAGGTVLVGQLLGAKREEDLRETVATLFSFYPLVALGLTAVLMLLSAPLLRLIGTPAECFDGALAYFRICIGGLVFTTGYNALSAVLRGLGDSRRPLLFVVIACVCNMAGDLVLVAGLGLGAAGAAIATTASQALSMLLGILYLRKKRFFFDFRPRSFRLSGDKVRALLRLGLPVCIQETLVMSSFIFLEAIINSMGYIAVAAAGVADRVFMVATIPAMAFSASISAMVAQNIGAGKPDRAAHCLRVGAGISFLIGLALFVWMWLAPASAIRIFTRDALVIHTAVDYLRSYKYEYLFCSIAFCIGGFVNGAGHPRFTLVNNLVSSFLVRVPLMFVLSRTAGATLFTVGIGMPIASAVQMLGGLLYLRFGKWRENRVLG